MTSTGGRDPGGEGASAPRPERVVVVSPRARTVRSPGAVPAIREIDEQTRIGAVYLRSLMRAQLRTSLLVLAVAAVVLGGLPLVFALDPRATRTHLLGLPLPWLLLGVLVYPALCGGAWWYVRAAERTEREFSDLVDRS